MIDLHIIQSQFRELKREYPRLYLTRHNKSMWCVFGVLHFVAEYQGQEIEDKYSIEIFILNDFPKTIPFAKETGCRIPKTFHHYQNEALCLGAPLAIKLSFQKEPSLLGFTKNCLIPYLYSFSYKSKYGKMPFGELPHGWPGLMEYYQNIFKVNDSKAILRLLEILAENSYQGHISCPCGSRKRLRGCHGSKLQELIRAQSPPEFKDEYMHLVESLK